MVAASDQEPASQHTSEQMRAGSSPELLHALVAIVGAEAVRVNEPMALHTSFAIGGPADYLVFPSEVEQVQSLVRYCVQHSVPYFLMGKGSDLLVQDGGIRGVVIQLSERFARWAVVGHPAEAGAAEGSLAAGQASRDKHQPDEVEVWAQSGISLRHLCELVAEQGLAGLEFASGIPGTLGGAVFMNAGAYGGEMKDVLVEAEVLSPDGQRRFSLSNEELRLGYRHSVVQDQKLIVLAARMRLHRDEPAAIRARMAELWQRRCEKQPLEYPSAGSVFKRPPGHYVGPMIQELGLQGTKIGSAEVSTKHAGFIVNRGGATAADVLRLIALIQERVKERFGVDLEPEIRIVGEP